MSGLAFQGLKRGLAVVVAEGRAVAPLASWRAPFASASDSFTDKFNKKEAAEERLYFNKEDEKLLRGLLGKMKVRVSLPRRPESWSSRVSIDIPRALVSVPDAIPISLSLSLFTCVLKTGPGGNIGQVPLGEGEASADGHCGKVRHGQQGRGAPAGLEAQPRLLSRVVGAWTLGWWWCRWRLLTTFLCACLGRKGGVGGGAASRVPRAREGAPPPQTGDCCGAKLFLLLVLFCQFQTFYTEGGSIVAVGAESLRPPVISNTASSPSPSPSLDWISFPSSRRQDPEISPIFCGR